MKTRDDMVAALERAVNNASEFAKNGDIRWNADAAILRGLAAALREAQRDDWLPDDVVWIIPEPRLP